MSFRADVEARRSAARRQEARGEVGVEQQSLCATLHRGGKRAHLLEFESKAETLRAFNKLASKEQIKTVSRQPVMKSTLQLYGSRKCLDRKCWQAWVLSNNERSNPGVRNLLVKKFRTSKTRRQDQEHLSRIPARLSTPFEEFYKKF